MYFFPFEKMLETIFISIYSILGMQALGYYVELIKYKPLFSTTIETFTTPSDCDGNNRMGCDGYTTTSSTTFRPFTTKPTEKPTSWTTSTTIKPTWWTSSTTAATKPPWWTSSTTTTTATKPPWWTTSTTQKPVWWSPPTTTTTTTRKPITVTWWKPTETQTWWPKPSTTDTWSQWISTKPTVTHNRETGK